MAMTCPRCGSANVDRDEVDIGVGTQCGPWACYDCGWSERDDLFPEGMEGMEDPEDDGHFEE